MSVVNVRFPRLNHFWNDSGVLGLYRCIIGNVHAERQEGDDAPGDRLNERFEVGVHLEPDALEIEGDEKAMEELLDAAYDRLVRNYYNVSTQKQREERGTWNFFFDSRDGENGRFKLFPKRKTQGIAAFIYDKASRPGGDQVKWAGRQPGKLPPSHAHLQPRLDAFLQEQGIQAGPPAGMLLDEPNRVRPNTRVRVKEGKPKGTCFLCGLPSFTMEKVSNTVFPFITGDSGVLSFFSTTRTVSQVCWRCAFVGKFVPVNGFYSSSGKRLHMFFPIAPSLTKMNEVYDRLTFVTKWEPNFWRNFEHSLGGYFTHPSETAFAFLHTVYGEVVREEEIRTDEEDEEEDDFHQELFDLVWKDAPLSFGLVSAEKKGNTQMPTQVWVFDDLTYLFRLFRTLTRGGTDWKAAVTNMLDSTAPRAENRSLQRNRMLDAILRKQSILHRAESFAFHVNRGQPQYIAPLVEFVDQYERIIRKGGTMDADALDAAVRLGKRIGYEVAKEKGKKGSLFALRKCRTLSDFLNELSRLQLRFGMSVPSAVYEGHLTTKNFEEFKGFCMLAALNRFNAGAAHRDEQTDGNDEGGSR